VSATVRPAPSSSRPAPWRRLTLFPALDGVRGLAVLLVVVTHLQLLVPYEVTGIDWLDDIIEGSYLGVDLFFVLSGFLITSLLLDEVRGTGNLRFGAFYARRALRLLPALYVMLAAHAVYAWIVDLSWLQEWATIRSAIFYVSNWQLVFRPLTAVPDLGLLWSLAIEEQFYLLWPAVLILFLGPRESAQKVSAILFAAIVAVALWRAHLWQTGVFWAQLAVRTDTRIDALLVGALLASLWVRGVTPKRWVNEAAWLGLAVLIGCLATFDITQGMGYKGGLTLFAVAAAAIILGLLGGTWGGQHLFAFRPLRALGRVSYGVYLWHYPVFYAVSVQGEQWTNLQRVEVAVALTVVTTLASWYLIERPALGLKRRFRVGRAATARASNEEKGSDGARTARPVPVPTATAWVPSSTTGRLAVGIVAVLVVGFVVRYTVFVGDPVTVDGVPQPTGLDFPSGDLDRSGYWSLVDLETTFEDPFDRPDDPGGLGVAEDGQAWEVISGQWGISTETAVVSGDAGSGPRIAVAPQQFNDGLAEVTLGLVTPGTGLVFRYQDVDNWWSATADPTTLQWTVTQVIDGEPTTAGTFSAPIYDGVTISVTQAGPTVRYLVDGVEYYRLLDPAPATVLRSGIIANGPESGGARWDRFQILANEDDVDGAG
jgi:peptidoglycan/LPS O-acetylase OafA/YrhL